MVGGTKSDDRWRVGPDGVRYRLRGSRPSTTATLSPSNRSPEREVRTTVFSARSANHHHGSPPLEANAPRVVGVVHDGIARLQTSARGAVAWEQPSDSARLHSPHAVHNNSNTTQPLYNSHNNPIMVLPPPAASSSLSPINNTTTHPPLQQQQQQQQ
eukprot:TRINITY_DN66525_c7_g11_i1.p1 TRINITY_DN66525_c7_g11~~TRINITY_DN66525_c7_g11_i1.p1  ORF type:complete len:157 (-),score=33.57 TRINITY_DN66525_c7_g11_i1:35-505(-)